MIASMALMVLVGTLLAITHTLALRAVYAYIIDICCAAATISTVHPHSISKKTHTSKKRAVPDN